MLFGLIVESKAILLEFRFLSVDLVILPTDGSPIMNL